MSKFTQSKHFDLRSRSSADLRMKASRSPTVIEISSIPSSRDAISPHPRNLESTALKFTPMQKFDTINSPKDYPYLKKKSLTRSATRTPSIVPNIQQSTSGEINLPSFRKTTIESLGQLHSGSILRKEISPIESIIIEERLNDYKADAKRNKLKVGDI